MRIAIVTESWAPATNGVVRSVQQVLRHTSGVEFHLIGPGASARNAPQARTTFTASAVPLAGLGYAASLPTPGLVRYLREVRPDVVHVASPFLLGAQALRAANLLGIPSVAVYQTDVAAFADANGFKGTAAGVWKWIAHTHARADVNLACTHDAVAALREHGVPRVRHWQRGVDLETFHPGQREETLNAFWGGGRPVVGYVGRLAPEKELPLLARLAADPRLQLVLIGDGPQGLALRSQLPEAHFTGHLDGADLPRAMASLDVVVHPGRHETLCQSVMQAMACGVPAVVPDSGGVRELVTPHSGRVVPVGDAAAIHAATREILADHARHVAGASGLSAARSMPASMGQLTATWREVLGRAPRATGPAAPVHAPAATSTAPGMAA